MQYDEFHFFSILYLIYNFHPAEYISVLKKKRVLVMLHTCYENSNYLKPIISPPLTQYQTILLFRWIVLFFFLKSFNLVEKQNYLFYCIDLFGHRIFANAIIITNLFLIAIVLNKYYHKKSNITKWGFSLF